MVEVKHCSRCDEAKPLEEFAWKRRDRGQRSSYCRACQKELMRAHYVANRQRYIERARKRTRRIRLERTQRLLDFFATHPCTDCGEADPVVLDFDHLADKCFDVGQMLAQHPWQLVLEEISKCEVVCANCHRRRTARRRPTVRLILSQADRQGRPQSG